MHRTLPYLFALLLGVGAAVLAACGQTTRGGIPAADASDLHRQLEDVRSRVADGGCDDLGDELRQVSTRIDELPRSVDAQLVQALRDGADRLQRQAVEDCNANSVPAETQTETAPTVTETAPPETTTVPETTPTETETTPTAPPPPPPSPTTGTVPPEPTAPPPPPPPVTPGGGVSPEVP